MLNKLKRKFQETAGKLLSESLYRGIPRSASTYLGRSQLLVKTIWDGRVVVPTWNVDVAIGVARDGVHEAWTTRLVQELLREGQSYLNAGANFGYYVALGGKLVGEKGSVYAMEPNPFIIPFLLRTIYWNGTVQCTKVWRAALSDTSESRVSMHFDPQFLGGGHIAAAKAKHYEFDLALWESDNWGEGVDGDIHETAGNFVPFECQSKTIDQILPDSHPIHLIHLDIEGAEPRALLGARQTIARNPELRLITEWSSYHYRQGDETSRRIHDEAVDMLFGLGFRVRHLEPRLSSDGGVFVSPPLAKEFLQSQAPHGDYVWARPSNDPWGS